MCPEPPKLAILQVSMSSILTLHYIGKQEMRDTRNTTLWRNHITSFAVETKKNLFFVYF